MLVLRKMEIVIDYLQWQVEQMRLAEQDTAMEMLLVARPTSAERALQLGLINEVCEREELMDVAMSWAEEICKNAPLSVQATKKSALRSIAVATLEEAYAIEDALSNEVFQTEDAKEGPRAFFEKRDPVWQGR